VRFFIVGWLVLVLVVGVFVTTVTALTETPEEKKEEQEKAEAREREQALADITPAAEIASRVEAIRGLRFRGAPPKVRAAKAAELTKQVSEADTKAAEEAAGANPAEDQATATAGALLLSQSTGLRAEDVTKAEETSGAGAIARFVAAERTVVVSGEALEQEPLLAEAAIAHEMARALDDQEFEAAPRRVEPLQDDDAALIGVREGSAARVEAEYAEQHLTGDVEQVGDVRRQANQDDSGALLAYAHFPSTSGERHVAALYDDGQWDAVNERLREPPTTTKAVLHPGEGAGDDEVDSSLLASEDLLPDGMRLVANTTAGELDVIAMLRAGLPERDARDAAEGWQAGGATVWSAGASCPPPCRDKSASLMTVRWDDETAARDFASAFRRSFEITTEAEREGGRAWTVDKAGAALVREGSITAVSFAPDVETAGRIATAAAQGASET
jgi:hypothetical protein